MYQTTHKSSIPIPTVTIIINCWNGEDFLKEAIDSVIKQTYQDWELILFDDRSTDQSANIFHSYHNDKFHYILAEQQLDLTAAREEAIKIARGEWIAFLDQDDIWLPEKLERQLQLLDTPKANEVGMIYGRAKRFGYLDAGQDFDHHYEGKPLPDNKIFNELALTANFIPMSSTVVRRKAFEQMAPVPDNVRLCPDYFFWMAISREWKTSVLQDTCCLYRVRGTDFSSSNGIQIFTEFLNVIEYFSADIPQKLLAKRRSFCQNLIATTEIRKGQIIKGVIRILKHGSLGHIIKRAPKYIIRRLNNFLS